MNLNYLSRKLILSAMLVFIATLFMWRQVIEPQQWLWAMLAVVIPYIAAHAIQAYKGGGYAKCVDVIGFWNRIKALFDTPFLMALMTLLVSSLFLYAGKIPADIWFVLTSAIAGAYNIGNVLTKS